MLLEICFDDFNSDEIPRVWFGLSNPCMGRHGAVQGSGEGQGIKAGGNEHPGTLTRMLAISMS